MASQVFSEDEEQAQAVAFVRAYLEAWIRNDDLTPFVTRPLGILFERYRTSRGPVSLTDPSGSVDRIRVDRIAPGEATVSYDVRRSYIISIPNHGPEPVHLERHGPVHLERQQGNWLVADVTTTQGALVTSLIWDDCTGASSRRGVSVTVAAAELDPLTIYLDVENSGRDEVYLGRARLVFPWLRSLVGAVNLTEWTAGLSVAPGQSVRTYASFRGRRPAFRSRLLLIVYARQGRRDVKLPIQVRFARSQLRSA
jgi:hypothetical protein